MRDHIHFFTDSLSHISNNPLSTMRRPHLIYGLLASGKSSFLLNQRILGETNWTFSTPAFQLQHFNSCHDDSISTPALIFGVLIPALSFTAVFFFPTTYSTRVIFLAVIKLLETNQYSHPHSCTFFFLM